MTLYDVGIILLNKRRNSAWSASLLAELHVSGSRVLSCYIFKKTSLPPKHSNESLFPVVPPVSSPTFTIDMFIEISYLTYVHIILEVSS